MTFTSVGFALFFAVVALLYYCVPAKAQNAVLAAASVLFYACNLPQNGALWQRYLPMAVLFCSSFASFLFGKAIAKAEGARRKKLTAAAVVLCVCVLTVFKYYNYFVPSVLGLTSFARLALPLGLSFYTFATISYLVDVSRGDMEAEQRFLNYFVFVSFFATITSGPICRAKKLLPQLAKPRVFSAQRTCDALRLALMGCFKWVACANVLGLYVNQVFDNLGDYTGLSLTLAAAMYALQLYLEFSGYSDMARGFALLLGLEIPLNFKTPYFAMNFSGFWSRWHMSLSSWLQDYVFMPLVWGRWTSRLPLVGKYFEKPPMISSVAIVFLLSGIWHGNTWPFFVWGCLQAIYRVGEELLHQWYKKPAKKPALWLRCFKTAGVFILWMQSLVFFRIGLLADGSVGDGFAFWVRQWQGISLGTFAAETNTAVQNGFYARPIMVAGYFAFLLVVLSICLYTDWQQCFRLKEKHFTMQLAACKTPVRWGVYYVLLACILVGFIMQSGGFGTVNFAYAGF